jgi:hypothetical protein
MSTTVENAWNVLLSAMCAFTTQPKLRPTAMGITVRQAIQGIRQPDYAKHVPLTAKPVTQLVKANVTVAAVNLDSRSNQMDLVVKLVPPTVTSAVQQGSATPTSVKLDTSRRLMIPAENVHHTINVPAVQRRTNVTPVLRDM